MPELLEQFEANVTARGGIVHWARDAEEANRIVTDLVRAKGVDEVIKVKSMATQEMGLNEHLDSEGIRAIETDLAELIVQLGEDKPSHILVPAIHRNRAEVREIFLEEMGRYGKPAPDDLDTEPAHLAGAAREHLRTADRLQPKRPWIVRSLFDMEARTRDWIAAELSCFSVMTMAAIFSGGIGI